MWKTLLRYADDFWRAGKAFFTSNKTAIANTADDVIKGAAASTDDIAAKAATLPPVGKSLGYKMADDLITSCKPGGSKVIGDNIISIYPQGKPYQVRAITFQTPNGTTVTKAFDDMGLRAKEVFNADRNFVTTFANDGQPLRLVGIVKGEKEAITSIVKAGKTLSPVEFSGRTLLNIPEQTGLRNLTKTANAYNPLYREMRKAGKLPRLDFYPGLGY